ncbi:hypothetical protein JQ631_26810 [Bradyrhizobium manausense]|uniref:hypothetical protein n=1 Tax=Bradyrhizobium manausense TaxID=989370 RepID=UPI001BAA75BD|nr:hypothetical protein [Bradyrhizobium manausense]MBR0792701.1 hypothetical protein [Bradyrhizobium manausense]
MTSKTDSNFINLERDYTESKRVCDETEANVRRVSSAKYFEEYNTERKAAILRNEEPSPRKTHHLLIAEAQTAHFIAIEDCEVHKERYAVALKEREQRVRKEVQPAIEADERIVAQCVAQALPALKRIEQTAAKLAGQNFGFWPPLRLETERVFKDSVFDRGSDMMQFLRQAASLGYIKLPEELR